MNAGRTDAADMILIADAHVNTASETQIPFFKMLERLENRDEAIIFLGDIFDLWMALPRYESDIHERFLDWCKRQKQRRTIGFIEGNHEFFLARQLGDGFTWCTDAPWYADNTGHIFCHGDRINPKDINYLRFRRLTKNRWVKLIARMFPMGPLVVDRIKQGMKSAKSPFRGYLPIDAVRAFSHARCIEGAHTIFIGHFHREYHGTADEGCTFHILPDWLSTGKVAVFSRENRGVKCLHWREI